jgi:WD40 repeat protein
VRVLVLKVKGAGRYSVDALAFGPNGRALAATCGTSLVLWDDLTNGTAPRVLKHAAARRVFGPIDFRTDGRAVVCHSDRGPLVRSLESDVAILIPAASFGVLCRAAFAPDGAVAVADYRPGGSNRGVLELQRPGDGTPPAVVWSVPTREIPTTAAVIAADGTLAVFLQGAIETTTQWRSAVVYHDANTGNVVRTSGPGPMVSGRYALSLAHGRLVQVRDDSFSVWRIDGANDWSRQERAMENDSRRNFTGIAFHPSGRYLAATSNDETVKLYDAHTWEVARAFTWKAGRMRSVCFSPDGALAAAGTDKGQVIVWDVDF